LPGEHYMLPPERRLGRVRELIEEHKFFTLHAGRQTGKTTSLMWLQDHLSRTGSWRALWVDIETAGLAEGWLVLFDLRKALSWEDKLFLREVEHAGKRVRIVGC
jgi:hypothetical protein